MHKLHKKQPTSRESKAATRTVCAESATCATPCIISYRVMEILRLYHLYHKGFTLIIRLYDTGKKASMVYILISPQDTMSGYTSHNKTLIRLNNRWTIAGRCE